MQFGVIRARSLVDCAPHCAPLVVFALLEI
jgi:hypothetical protein